VLLDVLDDVFLLNLALEAAECTFDGLAFLNFDFGHELLHPHTRTVACCWHSDWQFCGGNSANNFEKWRMC
jgi:hypothetical protein